MPPKKIKRVSKNHLHDDDFDLLEVEVERLAQIQTIDEQLLQQAKLSEKVQTMMTSVDELIARIEQSDNSCTSGIHVDLNDVQKRIEAIKVEQSIENAVALYEINAKYISALKQQNEKREMVIKKC